LITIPFFGVIACGYFASRRNILHSAGRAGLNQFVYYFALPVLIFSLMAQADLRGEFQWGFVAAYAGAGLVLFTLSLIIARGLLRMPADAGTVFATGCIYGNTGYLGLPFVIIAFGQQASVPIVICTTFDLVVMLPLASVLVEKVKISEPSLSDPKIYQKSLLSVVKNPLIIAVLLGALFSMSDLELPQVADRFFVLMGSAAAPCALFALGSSIDEDRSNLLHRQLWLISSLKLIVHPLLMWISMFHLFAVDAVWAKSALIAAAMPVAVTVYVLAQQHQTYVGKTSASILMSTIFSMATLSFILSQIGGL